MSVIFHELTVTLAEGAAQPPEVPGEILRQCRRARQCMQISPGETAEEENAESVEAKE